MSTDKKKKQVRESGIELLRLLAIFGVVFGHFYNAAGILVIGGGNQFIINLLLTFFTADVDIFILISGYFLCTSSKRTVWKPLMLILEVILINVGVYLASVIFGSHDFSLMNFCYHLLPINYFIILYVVLYIVSPYINVVLSRLSVVEWGRFMIMLLLIFSLFPMFNGILEHIKGEQINAFSPVGLYGSQAGYTIVNFAMVYCVGACIRMNNLDEKISWKAALVVIIVSTAVLYGLWLMDIKSYPWTIAGFYDNIFVIAIAAFMFILFKKIKFKSRFVNGLTGAVFTCFLIHQLFFFLVDPATHVQDSSWKILAIVILFFIVIYALSWLLWKTYIIVTKPLADKLDKVQIPLLES